MNHFEVGDIVREFLGQRTGVVTHIIAGTNLIEIKWDDQTDPSVLAEVIPASRVVLGP